MLPPVHLVSFQMNTKRLEQLVNYLERRIEEVVFLWAYEIFLNLKEIKFYCKLKDNLALTSFTLTDTSL